MAKALHFLRDSHLFHSDDCRWNGAEDGSRSLAVPERVAAEASEADDLVGEVGVVDVLEFSAILVEHDRREHLIDLFR